MYRFVRVLSATFVFLCLATSSLSGDLRIHVVDAEGISLPGAGIRLDGPVSRIRATDGAGILYLASLPSGTYSLRVSYVGFRSWQSEVSVGTTASDSITVVLEPVTFVQPEVVIAANRAETGISPITFSNLTTRDIETAPQMKDLPVLLARLPSVTWYSENGNGIGYSSLRLRGIDQRRVAVTINGVPQNDPEDHSVYWINFFDIQGTVRDIQVQRGAGSAFYGSTAIGGAINIVTDPYEPRATATIETGMGSYATRRLTAEASTGLMGNRWIAYGRFSRLTSDGYRQGSWSRFYRGFLGVKRVSERSSLTIQAYGGPQEDGLAYIGIPRIANSDPVARRANDASFTGDVESFFQPHLEVLHELRLSPSVRLNQVLFSMAGTGYFDFGAAWRSADFLGLPDDFPGDRSAPVYEIVPDAGVLFRAYVGQVQTGWLPRLTVDHALGQTTLGAEIRGNRSLHWGRVQEASGIGSLTGPGPRLYRYEGDKLYVGLTAGHTVRASHLLSVQADVQVLHTTFRHFNEMGFDRTFRVPYTFVNPRIGLTVAPAKPLSGYLSLAYAGREPQVKSLYDGEEARAGFQPNFENDAQNQPDFASPLVRPEYLLDLEAGLSYARDRFRIAATGYLMSFKDEIVPSGGLDQFGTPRTGNAPRTHHTGIELEMAARLLPGLQAEANATMSRNRFDRFTEYVWTGSGTEARVQDGHPIAGAPETTFNAGVVYNRSGMNLRTDLQYVGRQYVDNGGGMAPDGTADADRSIDAFVLVNTSFSYAFRHGSILKGVEVSMDVNNVLDRKVLLFGNVGAAGPQFFPAATRHVFVGLRYTFR